MEDILYCKDLYEPIEGDTAKPKDMDDEKWKRLHRKTIGHIRQWLDDSVFSHVSNETDAQVLWKKLEARYEQKTATNKAFLIRKLVNMKFKEGGSIEDHLNEFQSVVNQLATMKMVIEDELQALLLLSSLPDSWETLVVTMSNSAPDGKLSMGQVSSSLFNEETRRKLAGTDNAQALVSENRGRSKNRGHKGHGKSKGRSLSRGKSAEKGKCYHCGKEGDLKRNCYAWKREQKEENNNQKKNEEKNTTATFEGDEVVVLSCGEEECLHVGNEIEWVVDTGASYHATYNKEFFTSYKAGDFGTVKMGNTSHSKIVGIGDVCIRTSVGCMMTLRDVRHVPNLRLNLISGITLDREGYMNYFGNGVWKLTKGSLVVARGKACCTLYKTNLKVIDIVLIPLPVIIVSEKKKDTEIPFGGNFDFYPVRYSYSIHVEPGKTVALIGASGSGKSTAIALLQRFYDTDSGVVRIDGVDIKTLQLKWLKGKMGLVSQEQALFGTSIKENIMFGKLDATMNEVMAAAMAAHAHNFIMQLTAGYETKVGQGNTSPKFTRSSLHGKNHTVAHKLSTIRNADLIAVMSGGCITEIAKSSAERPSTAKSSPAVLASPLVIDHNPQPLSYPPPSFSRLLPLNSPEWKQGLIGSLSAIAFGAVQPIYALTIGGMISAFFSPSHEEMRAQIQTYSLVFSSLALISIIVNLSQHYNFGYMGGQLTKRIRLKMLEKILTFEAAWFDEEQNSSGALCSRLSNEASMVKSLLADRVSLILQTISAATIAMIIGLVVAWKLALVMIAVQPLTILCFYTRKVLLSTISTNFVKAQNQSTQIAVEAVYNHRIVTSFGRIGKVLQLFDKAQDESRKEATKKSWLAGISMGSAQGLTFICWALDFCYGAKLVDSGKILAGDVFKTFFILVSTGRVIAEAGSMTSDLAKGSMAVTSVFAILDRQSLIPGS
ncbi:hypothetical protein F0562_018180 [Nyssa sinensis]|uniref:CCHC-type domain-containing protein n=1 Tax=Nyssa sinensis TaxID=561372 RepID=A0A5J4Z8K7_9ASTE|nr:hypothetical protein F0562_018180 [Nyssa sinensis]